MKARPGNCRDCDRGRGRVATATELVVWLVHSADAFFVCQEVTASRLARSPNAHGIAPRLGANCQSGLQPFTAPGPVQACPSLPFRMFV